MGWWPFKKKRKTEETGDSNPVCPDCASRNTRIKVNFGNDQPDYVKTWRGQRYLTYHCADCGSDFSTAAPKMEIDIERLIGDGPVDDEEALREAEDALKRQTDQEGDHRYG